MPHLVRRWYVAAVLVASLAGPGNAWAQPDSYTLAVAPSAYGTVTGPGINCGSAATDCAEQYGTAGVISVQAVPAAGYRFLGWTGSCEGGAFTTVIVDGTRECEAIFGALRSGSQPQDPRLSANALLVQSDPGNPVGGGRRDVVVGGDMRVSLFVNGTNLDVYVSDPQGAVWLIDFTSPAGQLIGPGVYEEARGVGRSAGPGIDVSRANPHGACAGEEMVGRFVIYELTLASPGSSTVASFAADFEYRCAPAFPALVGSVRYNSSRAELRPFPPPAPPFTRFDVTGDRRADFVWQNRNSGQLWVWHMHGASHVFDEPILLPAVADTNWHIVGSGDANLDGYADLYWQHQTTGALAIWYKRETELLSAEPLSPATVEDTNWKVRTVADMDADGYPDLVWQHIVSGHVAVWFMNGRQQRRGESLGPGPVPDVNWTIVGTGDVNRDGWPDLYWHHVGTGDLGVWLMRARTLLAADPLIPSRVADLNWRVRGVVDVDGNASPDLVWQNAATQQVAVWFMQGRELLYALNAAGPSLSDAAWHLVSPR